MTADPAWRGRATALKGRLSERRALDRLVEAVRGGESRSLVVHGDPGVGKTVLLDYLAGQAAGAGCRVARAVGVQWEMELAFAGLHQVCGPMLGRAGRLPVPQQNALRTAFGIAAGPPPDRFLVGLAVLSLLSEVAGERPLICLIDDEQWLDQASAQALGFTARRLGADPVGLVFAAREPGPGLAGLAELEIGGLEPGHPSPASLPRNRGALVLGLVPLVRLQVVEEVLLHEPLGIQVLDLEVGEFWAQSFPQFVLRAIRDPA
jgi:AAA ATPase domain